MKKPKNAKAAKQPATEPKKRGRPAGSGKKTAAAKPDKAAVKAEKDAAKAAAKTAAANAAIGHNSADPKLRTLFLAYMNGTDGNPCIPNLKALVSKANSKYRAALKAAKKDGFEQFMFETAALVSTPEGELEFKTRIGRQLQAAQFMGSTVGNQLDLFNEPDRTPAVDRAYDEGKQASMENKQASPGYDPSTAQYARYLEGFHDNEAKKLKGMKKTGDKSAVAPDVPKAPPAPTPIGSGQTSGVPMTRSQLAAMKASQAAAPAPETAKGEHIGDVDADDEGGFARRPAAGNA